MTEFPSLIFPDIHGHFTLADGTKKSFLCSHCLLSPAYVKYKSSFWCETCLPKETLKTERRNYLLEMLEVSFSVRLGNEEYLL